MLSLLFRQPITRIAACGGTILGTAHFTNPFRSFTFCYIKMNFYRCFVRNVTIDWQLNMLCCSILRISYASGRFCHSVRTFRVVNCEEVLRKLSCLYLREVGGEISCHIMPYWVYANPVQGS